VSRYYTSAERVAYRPGPCELCGRELDVIWYAKRATIGHTSDVELFWPSVECIASAGCLLSELTAADLRA
jgi:hypothetical protein